MDRNRGWIGDWLASPPQTNEVRRASGLLAGLSVLAEQYGLPLDLYELGASEGLNLYLDRFAYRNNVWRRGDGPVTIDSDWSGPAPPSTIVHIDRRRGCDQHPLLATDANHRLRLRSYVWPDQPERMANLEAALVLAANQGTVVDESDAATWLAGQLGEFREARTSVVFHSIFWHYPPLPTLRRIESLMALAGSRATLDRPLGWLRFEFEAALGGPRASSRCLLDLTTWPGGHHRVLAEVDSHGRFVHWRSPTGIGD